MPNFPVHGHICIALFAIFYRAVFPLTCISFSRDRVGGWVRRIPGAAPGVQGWGGEGAPLYLWCILHASGLASMGSFSVYIPLRLGGRCPPNIFIGGGDRPPCPPFGAAPVFLSTYLFGNLTHFFINGIAVTTHAECRLLMYQTSFSLFLYPVRTCVCVCVCGIQHFLCTCICGECAWQE